MVENIVSRTIAPLVEALGERPKFEVACLRKILGQLEIGEDWIDEMTEGRHEGDCYHRVLLYQGETYEIVLAVWPVGTQTLVHNHGSSNSFGMVKILRGSIFNHLYHRIAGPENRVGKDSQSILKPGDLADVPLELVHQMGNASSQGYAASLHIYSPAIVEISYWDPETGLPCDL